MSQIINTKSWFEMIAFVFILLLFLFQHIWEGKSCAMCISRVSKCIPFWSKSIKTTLKFRVKNDFETYEDIDDKILQSPVVKRNSNKSSAAYT